MKPEAGVLTIRTPEACTFSFTLAGPVSRFLAWLMDLMIIAAANMIVSKILLRLYAANADIASALSMLVFFAFWLSYGFLMEWFFHGRTLGKMLLRLRVMDENALHLSFSQVLMRNTLRMVDMLPFLYLVGGISCILTKRFQRLGDIVAGTVVVRASRPSLAIAGVSIENKYNSFRQYPHLVARLRRTIDGDEAYLAQDALLRRDQLDTEARKRVYKELADLFRTMAAFPPEALEGLSDEQYVRNVVDAVFN